MALIVEDGSTPASANSYIDAAWADTYHSERANAAWAGSTTVKEAAILRGMEYIENFSFKGRKASKEQALEFPREQLKDRNNYSIGSDEIPVRLQKAVAEAALAEIQNPQILLGATTRNIKRKKVDVLETEYFSAAGARVQQTMILNLLEEFISSGAGCYQIIRSLGEDD